MRHGDFFENGLILVMTFPSDLAASTMSLVNAIFCSSVLNMNQALLMWSITNLDRHLPGANLRQKRMRKKIVAEASINAMSPAVGL